MFGIRPENPGGGREGGVQKIQCTALFYSSEREIEVPPAGHGGTGLAPSISSFTSSPPFPPTLKAERGFTPSPPLGGRGGQLVKLEIDGGELVPPCPAGYTSISRSLL